MNGSGVSGIQVTNIGFGYSDTFPARVSFQRNLLDFGISGATGEFLRKTTGIYDFNNHWDISCGFGSSPQQVSGYNGYYSGDYTAFGLGSCFIQVNCTGLDNTSAVSGLLSITISGDNKVLKTEKIVSQSRTFDLFSGALYPNSFPTYTFLPFPDMQYLFAESQFDTQYQADTGGTSNIINF